jgi:hypothetical protein
MNEDKFFFEGDERAKSYALRIARTMVRLFYIPFSEAVGRINREWKNKRIIGLNQIYRRDPEEWAKLIYYEDGTYWWVEKWMAEHTPKPKPYP